MNDNPSAMHDNTSSNGPVGGIDPLTSMLHGLRLEGLDYGRRRLDGVWAFSFPEVDRAYFHAVTGQPIWLFVDKRWSEIGAGDAILLPRGTAHLLASAPDALPPPFPAWQCRSLCEESPNSASSADRVGSLILYGSMQFNLDLSHPLFLAMPPALQAGSLLDAEPGMLPLLDALATEMTSSRVGAAGMATRLADVLAMQIIRSWVEHSCIGDHGWIAAARHPRIGLALAAIHARPDEDWTVIRLAGQVGMSRSAFAATFAAVVGDTPTRYLTQVRMHQARLWIEREGMRIADVAHRFHYDSEASFSRSFKRVVGAPPSFYRAKKAKKGALIQNN